MWLWFCLAVINYLRSVHNKKWPERKKRDEFWPKIWVKIVTDSQRDDVADRGRVSCGSRCIIVYNESSCAINWDNLAALVNNPSLSYFFRHLNPRMKGLYHHKCISVKASFFFFPPNVQTCAFPFHLVKLQSTDWFWTAFCVPDYVLTKQRAMSGGALEDHCCFSSETLFLPGTSSVKGHLKAFCKEEASGTSPITYEGMWEKWRKV